MKSRFLLGLGVLCLASFAYAQTIVISPIFPGGGGNPNAAGSITNLSASVGSIYNATAKNVDVTNTTRLLTNVFDSTFGTNVAVSTSATNGWIQITNDGVYVLSLMVSYKVSVTSAVNRTNVWAITTNAAVVGTNIAAQVITTPNTNVNIFNFAGVEHVTFLASNSFISAGVYNTINIANTNSNSVDRVYLSAKLLPGSPFGSSVSGSGVTVGSKQDINVVGADTDWQINPGVVGVTEVGANILTNGYTPAASINGSLFVNGVATNNNDVYLNGVLRVGSGAGVRIDAVGQVRMTTAIITNSVTNQGWTSLGGPTTNSSGRIVSTNGAPVILGDTNTANNILLGPSTATLVAIGQDAAEAITNGLDSVFLGASSGGGMEDSKKNIFIGTLATSSLDRKTNQIAIGWAAATTNDNQVVIGNSLTEETWIKGRVNVGGFSASSRVAMQNSAGFMTNVAAGAAGEFLKADGTSATPPGGSATPGGNSGYMQYNKAGAFGGTNQFIYNETNTTLALNTDGAYANSNQAGFMVGGHNGSAAILIQGLGASNRVYHSGMQTLGVDQDLQFGVLNGTAWYVNATNGAFHNNPAFTKDLGLTVAPIGHLYNRTSITEKIFTTLVSNYTATIPSNSGTMTIYASNQVYQAQIVNNITFAVGDSLVSNVWYKVRGTNNTSTITWPNTFLWWDGPTVSTAPSFQTTSFEFEVMRNAWGTNARVASERNLVLVATNNVEFSTNTTTGVITAGVRSIVTNIANIQFVVHRNSTITMSNLVVSFNTNTHEIIGWTNLFLTNLVGIADNVNSSTKIFIRPSGNNMTNFYPAFNTVVNNYVWRTNQNSPMWTVMTNGVTYVLSLEAIGTNIFSTLTPW